MTATIHETPEHELLRDQVARFIAKEVEPHAPHCVWSLPPEALLRQRPGKAGSAALAGQRRSKAKASNQQRTRTAA